MGEAKSGRVNNIMRLIRQGADKDYQDGYGNTALIIAAENGHKDLVKKLINVVGVDVNLAKSDGTTALHLEVLNNHFDNVKLLVDKRADVNAKARINYRDNYTPLILASMNGYIKIVEYLLEQRPDIGAQTEEGCDAFQWAAKKGNIEVVRYFIENVRGCNDP